MYTSLKKYTKLGKAILGEKLIEIIGPNKNQFH